MATKFCGKTQEEIKEILYFMCECEDELKLTAEDEEKYDIAIQCISVVFNHMYECSKDKPIVWDD